MKNSAGYNGSKHSKTESSHAFTAKLGEWWRERGHRLKIPRIKGLEVDLLGLWEVVEYYGGSREVCKTRRWADIGRFFAGDPNMSSSSASYLIKRIYVRWLWHYERHLKPSKAMPDDSAKPYYHASDIPNTPAEQTPVQDPTCFRMSSFYTCTPSTGHDSMEQEHCEVIYANDRRDSDRSTNSDNVVTGNNKIVLAKQSKGVNVQHGLEKDPNSGSDSQENQDTPHCSTIQLQVMHAASLQSWYEGQISEICKKYDMEVKMLHETIECQQKKLNSMRQELQASRIQGQECRRCFNQLLASTAGRNDMDVWIVPIANQPQQGIEDQ